MNAKINMRHKEILKTCQRIEEQAAYLYHQLADIHQSFPEMAALWQKTAAEEENHARQFEMALRMIDDLAEKILIEKSKADATLDLLAKFQNKVANEKLDPVKSLEVAIQVEEYMFDLHVHVGLAFTREKDKKMFEAMMAADKGHVDALKEQLARLKKREEEK